MYLQLTEEKPKVVTVQSGHPDWHSETHHGYAEMFGLSHCEFFLRRITHGSIPGTVSKKFRISRKTWQSAETNNIQVRIVQKRIKTRLNIGSTDVETHQASWPTVGSLQGDGPPYNSQDMCSLHKKRFPNMPKDTAEKTWKKIPGNSKSTCKRTNYYVHKSRKISPKMICNIDM